MSFFEITGPEYLALLKRRLSGEEQELTWLRQARDLLTPFIAPNLKMLDIGCAVGHTYNSFRQFGIDYLGVYVEPAFLDVARTWFEEQRNVSFLEHNVAEAPLPEQGDLLICSAMLERCPELMPTLKHLAMAARRVLFLRTSLGDREEIHHIPSPVEEFKNSHQKYNNQYTFRDVLGYLESEGFHTRVHRDAFTDVRSGYRLTLCQEATGWVERWYGTVKRLSCRLLTR